MKAAADHRLRAEAVSLAQNDAEQRHGEAGAGHEHAGDMAYDRGLFGFGPTDHEARRIAQRQNRNVEGIAKLHEAARPCRRRSAVDRATQVLGLLAD